MFAKLLKRAGIGFLLGIAVGNIIVWISYATGGTLINPDLIARTGSETAALAIQTITMGLYGVFAFGGMTLYEIDSWPLVLSTGVHFLIIAVNYVIMEKFLCWNGTLAGIAITLAIMLVIFFLIWLLMYFRYRNEVYELNEELQDLQETEQNQ